MVAIFGWSGSGVSGGDRCHCSWITRIEVRTFVFAGLAIEDCNVRVFIRSARTAEKFLYNTSKLMDFQKDGTNKKIVLGYVEATNGSPLAKADQATASPGWFHPCHHRSCLRPSHLA